MDRLATVLNDTSTDIGFLRFRDRTSTFLLFSDPSFVWWLVRRTYSDGEYLPEVYSALEDARRSYLSIASGTVVLLAVALAIRYL